MKPAVSFGTYYARLRRWSITAVLIIAFIPLVLLAGTIHYHYGFTIKEKLKEELHSAVENKRNTINTVLHERALTLEILAHVNGLAYLRNADNLERVFRILNKSDANYLEIGILDQNGNQIAGSNKAGTNRTKLPWFDRAMACSPCISGITVDERSIPYFVIAVPVRDEGNNWIFWAAIKTTIIRQAMAVLSTGRNSDAYILDKEGKYQVCIRDPERVLSKSGFGMPGFFSGVRQKEGYHSERGPLMYAMTWLNDNKWLLVVEQDVREELSPLVHTGNIVLIMFIAGSVIVVLSTVIAVRRVIGRLETMDRERSELTEQLIHSGKLAAIGKLATGIGHEINNPLAVIAEKAGWIEDLIEEDDIKRHSSFAELVKATNDIKKHVNRAKKVTHRLLGFARRTDVVYEELDLHGILEETIYFLEREARFRNIAIVREYKTDLPRINSDGAQLQQVFLNILSNGIDAVDRDGKITISTGIQGGMVFAGISDTGPGIPKDNLERIFDPFFTTKGVGKGTGLGLSISYSIIKRLGGSLRVESEPGKGTTFYVTLPVASEERT